MADENNTETVKIDIHGKIRCTVQDGERECLLDVNSEAESWIDQVKSMHVSKKYLDRKTSDGVSIYRVPPCIKNTKHESYDPVVALLGPYHHRKHQQLTVMDEYKLQAVDRTLERIPRMTVEQLVMKVEELEMKIRSCYEDWATEWDRETLAWMMVMDGCFILEFLRMELPNSSLVFCSQRSDNIKRREIVLDILKLENQIPFFILQMIVDLEIRDPGAVPAFLAKRLDSLIGGFFQGYPFSLEENRHEKTVCNGVNENENVIAKLINGGVSHLLDLSRRVIENLLSNSASGCESDIPPKSCSCNVQCGVSTCIATPNGVACFRGAPTFGCLRRSSRVDGSMIPSAEKLQRAGIKLKLSTEGKFDFKRNCFRRGTLYLPQIIVDDDTEIFLRNLVAFEECQRKENSAIKRVISRNMYIMDNLIDSKEDVGLFRRANIVKNYLGTEEEVARIFNDLCVGITYKGDFENILRNVNEHYNSQLTVWISDFRKEHCSRPWYVISLVAAVILLVLTLLQTIYTMRS
ncbi:hypothetical protein SUGI_1007120 [Cryptomeria japonica]|uniref:putative UPF0481 protein At3g02645 n=1 Tax=Cryptomeria japonica TaxID=3369 RepID=UPI002414C63E|nr:putative UPF0481 protein At3g02645 [Cryptomeria japonica]GLJ47688.1 hypothetical protein SUGI_1007120 [Cryptomeria japonica]